MTHYKASWAHWNASWPDPTWPLKERNGKIVDRETIRRALIAPWQELEKKGVGMFVGEWGVHQHTPHKVALAWMRDMLGLFKEAGWGWALWNFVGTFGVCESGRADVKYEDVARPQARQGHGRAVAGVLTGPRQQGLVRCLGGRDGQTRSRHAGWP